MVDYSGLAMLLLSVWVLVGVALRRQLGSAPSFASFLRHASTKKESLRARAQLAY